MEGRPITWSRWITSPVISHYDQSCEWCGDKGPGEMTGGRQGSPMSRTDPLRRYIAYHCIAHHKSRAPKDCNR